MCLCVRGGDIRLLKLPLCLGRSFHCEFNAVERIVGESAFNLRNLAGLVEQRKACVVTNKPACTQKHYDHCGVFEFKGR